MRIRLGSSASTASSAARMAAPPSGAMSTATPAGDDRVHHQPVARTPPRRRVAPSPIQAEAGQEEPKAASLQMAPNIAKMVGDPFQLRHDAAQGVGARGRLDLQRGFRGAGEGDGMGHRRIAGEACGEACGGAGRLAAHHRQRALVRVAEPGLEAHHRFAGGVEAEMPGFDDAGMDRPDRDLVQALALGGEEDGFLRQHRRCWAAARGAA